MKIIKIKKPLQSMELSVGSLSVWAVHVELPPCEVSLEHLWSPVTLRVGLKGQASNQPPFLSGLEGPETVASSVISLQKAVPP